MMRNARNFAPGRAQKRGYTLIEMAIATSMLVIVLGALAAAIRAMQGQASGAQERAVLQTSGHVTLVEIMRDLRRSGVVTSAGIRYPIVFEDGDPGPDHPDHAHDPANKNGQPGNPDFGPDREILFLLPRDDDGDRRPDVDEDGELLWGADVHSYVLVTRPDGVNVLERRVNGESPRIVARHVERVVFDDAASSSYEIPLGSVRVRLFLRRVDSSGRVQRYFTEAVVSLRNG